MRIRIGRILLLVVVGGALIAGFAMSCTTLYLPFGLTINVASGGGEPVDATVVGQRLRLPRGFAIEPYATGIGNARSLALTAAGHLLVSTPRAGKVLILEPDRNGDGSSDGTRVLAEGFDKPFGLAIHEGWLYVAETGAVRRASFDETSGTRTGDWQTIVADLPRDGNHWSRSLGFGPDGWLYVHVGSSCNVCEEDDPRRAAILRFRPDGSDGEIFASGLRNSVGFDWQPGSGAMFATDNGRDLLGDDFPPCELNHIVQGGFYGWPYANGNKIPDPDYGEHVDKVAASLPPTYAFRAHNAPLGIEFYSGESFPARYRGAAFVALHGSWNRSSKDGYKVVALWIDGDEVRAEDFLVGFEENENVIGRPVDFETAADGSLYLSDDFSGTIYRISYGEGRTSQSLAAAAPKTDPLVALSAAEKQAGDKAGAETWDRAACGQCHLPGGATEAFRPLAGLAARYDIEGLVALLRTPQPPMPIFELDDVQRRELAIHLLQRFP